MSRKKQSVLDERETQELYQIEHRGLWLMYALLWAVSVAEMLLGMGALALAGELIVLGVSTAAMIAGYVRRGIWDAYSRPSARGNAAYSALCAVAMGALAYVRWRSLTIAALMGLAIFALSLSLLTALMLVMRRVQKKREMELDDEDAIDRKGADAK